MSKAIQNPTGVLRLNDRFGEGYRFVDQDADRLTEMERRTLRARTDAMLVVPRADPGGECIGMYDVFSASGSWYVVDLAAAGEQVCDCPDAEHNRPDRGCKHYRRIKLAIDETPLPAPSESTSPYWPWIEEQIRHLTAEFPGVLDVDPDLETAVTKAHSKAREEMKMAASGPEVVVE